MEFPDQPEMWVSHETIYQSLYVQSRGANTNGLLRQYFPKGTDLSVHSAADLNRVAQELNDRPRKRLSYHKPIEEIGELLLR